MNLKAIITSAEVIYSGYIISLFCEKDTDTTTVKTEGILTKFKELLIFFLLFRANFFFKKSFNSMTSGYTCP